MSLPFGRRRNGGAIGGALTSLGGLAVLLISETAAAGDATLAEALFQEGRAEFTRGEYATACPKLEESYRQDPAPGTLLAEAVCEEAAGRLATAWTHFRTVVGLAERDGRNDWARTAGEAVSRLEPHLSRLTVRAPTGLARVPRLEIRRDGVILPVAAWGLATPVDGGQHVIEASAPGYEPFHETILVAAASEHAVVTIGGLTPLPAPPPKAPADARRGTTPVAPSPGVPRQSAGLGAVSTLGLALGSIGLVTLGVGGFEALHANDLNQAAKDQGCQPDAGICPPDALPTGRDARSTAELATGLAITGGVFTAGGLTLLLLGLSSDTSAPRVSLAVNGRGVAVGGAF